MVSFDSFSSREENASKLCDDKGVFGEEEFAWQKNMSDDDPWKHVKDIKGDLHYRVLSIPRNATIAEIKTAYRQKAREHHPDKGGYSEMFDKVQKAFETLSCPKKREQYDNLQHVTQYRYIPGVTQRAVGGEDLLLDDIARLGLETDASTQLVVLCEVCGRPSTRVCMCSLYYCDFCERKQHWKGEFGLHWPCTQSDRLKVDLAKKELEEKKKEDAKRYELEDPNFRDPASLREIREFKEHAAEIYSIRKQDHTRVFDMRLARYYMWAQTTRHVYIAIMLPTGYKDKELHMDFRGQVLVVQSEDSPPVVERHLAFQPSREFPVQTMQTDDKRFLVLSIPKSNMGEDVKKCFEGDPDYVRCMQPPYTLYESNTEVIMEIELPFWIDEEDVRVDITKRTVRVRVTNEIDTIRHFWWKTDGHEELRANWEAIVPEECAWSLDDESVNSKGEKCRILMICFAKPSPDKEEREYKKNMRQDNRFAAAKWCESSKAHESGVRFFIEDEDDFDLESLLISMVFMETGSSFVPAKPEYAYHAPFDTSKTINDVNLLPTRVKTLLDKMLDGAEAFEKNEEEEVYLNEYKNWDIPTLNVIQHANNAYYCATCN